MGMVRHTAPGALGVQPDRLLHEACRSDLPVSGNHGLPLHSQSWMAEGGRPVGCVQEFAVHAQWIVMHAEDLTAIEDMAVVFVANSGWIGAVGVCW
jgi:hypothetical protein